MANFEYSFDLTSDKNGYMLSFHDFKGGSFQAPTRDKIIAMAQQFLDDKIYDLLKNKRPIPVPGRKVPASHRLSPSEPLKIALEYHLNIDIK
ncbi:MAG: hypothetical protein AAF621_03880 [Pseudomonadota bacterium]